MKFLKNRNVLLTYNPKLAEETPTAEDSLPDSEKVNHIAEKTKEIAKYVAITAVGVYAAVKVIDTVSQIAVKKTKSADEEK